jgi:hypothetical protein
MWKNDLANESANFSGSNFFLNVLSRMDEMLDM